MSKIFIILAYLILQLVLIKSQNTFVPKKRASHTATLIDKKLYILGGYSLSGTEDEIVGQQFFYVDFSESFIATQVKWVDLTNINLAPPHRRGAAARGGENDDKLILFGGEKVTRELAIVYMFDTVVLSWSTPKPTGTYIPFKKSSVFPIMNNRTMYLFGGYVLDDRNYTNNYMDDMDILNTVDFTITKGSFIDAPTPRGYYGAVLLDQKILYIGGTRTDIFGLGYSLDRVYLYDITSDRWSNQPTTGTIPSNRDSFSAILGPDGKRVVIYGGSVLNNNALNALYVLNVETWEWYIPKVSGDPPSVVTYSHRAVLVNNKYMVITFGNNENQTLNGEISDILLLDISRNDEYVWTNVFNPGPHPSPPPPISTSSNFVKPIWCNIMLFSWSMIYLFVSFI